MRRQHFEQFRPVCPVCVHQRHETPQLQLATVVREQGDVILEGVLHCSRRDCQREYPIVDGIPLLVGDLRTYVANNLLALMARNDLSPTLEGIIGDCCGPASAWDGLRTQLSCYTWDHYGEFDSAEPADDLKPGNAARVLDRMAVLAKDMYGPVLDVGCAVGRCSFALAAQQDQLVLGVDANLAMLRVASEVLLQGRVRYPRKRIGLVYDHREFEIAFPGSERVDFWACDAQALPFAPETFGTAVALNVLDCVASPLEMLTGIRRVLRRRGTMLVTSPYDWSPSATAVQAWIGGHSQRGEHCGAAEPLLRALLTPGAHPQAIEGMEIIAEAAELPWHVRLHERSSMDYRVHGLVTRVVAS